MIHYDMFTVQYATILFSNLQNIHHKKTILIEDVLAASHRYKTTKLLFVQTIYYRTIILLSRPGTIILRFVNN